VKNIKIFHSEGIKFLEQIPDNSVDLILTDPPYVTSRDSGMDKWVDHVARQDAEGAQDVKTEAEWLEFSDGKDWDSLFNGKKYNIKTLKDNYLKYGSIYGKKYAVRTNYGEWDSEFTMEQLQLFTHHFYRILRDGGSCIIFFDLWKITNLKDMLEDAKFKQLRFIEWIKTNPQPINSSRNYLTNCREIALTAVKKGSSTFNSKYDKGIYEYPIYGGKKGLDRFHPTQKSLKLFEDLINKHSDEGAMVLDCFLGSGTTALAAHNTNRKFIGCELDEEYYNKTLNRLKERAL
jgi:site-specific DNA-methyltransferase (adenine-specific)